MPIKIPNDLPARRTLEVEGVRIIRETDAIRQDIRPLRIALLNLMPDKIRTETQIARVVGSTPLQVEMTLLTTGTYRPKNTPERHLLDFYKTWHEVRHEKFDGLIITGAPIETMPFEKVDYWDELTTIFDWAQTHVHSGFYICWAAQAALHYFHDVPKHQLEKKMFGIFRHLVLKPEASLLQGFNDQFSIPVSRHTETRKEDIPNKPGLTVLAESPESGLCLMEDVPHRAVYMFNHLEYDADTLKGEFERDKAVGQEIQIPRNYFPDDDPAQEPINQWRSYAHLLFWNWIGDIYQTTSFDVARIGDGTSDAPALGKTA
jgi:homoserine O-succinyltransferase/O-acetyltransferase